LILYTKPDCHLCDDLKLALAVLQDDLRFTVEERNIEADPVAFAALRYLIPVLELPGGSLLYPPHDLDTIRRGLVQAGSAPATHPT
jgi:hypothetical protein